MSDIEQDKSIIIIWKEVIVFSYFLYEIYRYLDRLIDQLVNR